MEQEYFKKVQEIQTLYETAMSIGLSMDLPVMLKQSLSVLLRKLNCTAGAVFQFQNPSSQFLQADPIFLLPRRIHQNANYQEAVQYLQDHLSQTGTDWRQAFPIEKGTALGDYFYLAHLKDFGMLLLVKNNKPIDPNFWQTLQPIFDKLALSCVACINTSRLHQMLDHSSEKIRQSKRELIVAREKAEAANKAKSRFLSQMTHELRTPMNGVIGMASLLEETALDQEQTEMIEIIRNSGEMLLFIINDILDFSKIEAGKLTINKHYFELREHVNQALKFVQERADKKGLALTCDIADHVPTYLQQDSSRIKQILLNLLANAIKFTDEGSVHISIKSKPLNKNRHKVVFAIQDTGIGIPKDKLNRLFKAFSQVDDSTSRRFEGTGLGLSISRQLAQLMNGNVWVESTTGVGSTFSFSILAEGLAPGEEMPKSLPPGNIFFKRTKE